MKIPVGPLHILVRPLHILVGPLVNFSSYSSFARFPAAAAARGLELSGTEVSKVALPVPNKSRPPN